MVIKPTLVYKLFGEAVMVCAFGRRVNNRISDQEMCEFAHDQGASIIFHPDTSAFDAQIIQPDPLDISMMELGHNKRVLFGRKNLQADGVVLAYHQRAAWLTTADCPTIVARHRLTKMVIVAHAGRASLINQHQSVVDTIVHRLTNRDFPPNQIEVFSCVGVAAQNFIHALDDEFCGRENAKLIELVTKQWGEACFENHPHFGRLDLHELIAAQFRNHGVPQANIRHDQVDTADPDQSWYSHRADTSGAGKQNHVLVVRKK